MPTLKVLILFLSLAICYVDSARILGIFHMPSKSHHIIGSALLKTLAKRGHDVTMISPFPFKKKIPNYRDIFVEETLTYKETAAGKTMMNPNKTALGRMLSSLQMFEDITELVLNNKDVQKLKNEHFDLVILFGIYSYTLLGLADHFKAPVILLSTVGTNPVTDEYVGNPTPTSYVPNMMFGGSADLQFFMERVKSTVLNLAFDGMTYMIKRGQRQQLKRHFPNAPSLDELMHNVSLVFVNSHYSIENPRPFVPNMIQIGGLHIEEARKLPEDLQTLLDDAKDGAILFCMGSNYLISGMDKDKLQAIMTSLGELNEQVLFKSEIDIPHAPKNVKILNWLPQSDVLAHPNVKVFISHGGLGSTTEAVYRGVPILGMPMFGDQQMNIALAVRAGYAVEINFADINVATFSAALREILLNDKYRKNVELRSSLLTNQPIKPMDNAVFWVEHVIKYKGAQHLQNAGINLTWYQHRLLDVFLFIVTVLSVSIWFIYFILKKIVVGTCRLVRRPKVKTQ